MRIGALRTRRAVPRTDLALGRPRASRPPEPLVVDDLLAGQTFAFIAAPGPVRKVWVEAGYPTVRVEKGWGSGVYQDLYPDSSGSLRTAPHDGGELASSWAGASKLLVERIYNQAGSDPASDYVTALAADKRVLLNVATAGAPFFAGYSTGAQDANQHATQRGYGIPTNMVKSAHFAVVSLDAPVGAETVYMLQDSATGTTRYFVANDGSIRHYLSWLIQVGKFDPQTMPQLKMQWSRDHGSKAMPNGVAGLAATWGGRHGVSGGDDTPSATSYALNIFGPSNSLQGKSFGLLIAKTALSDASVNFTGLPKSLARLSAKALAADEFSVVFPRANEVIPMDLATQKADIPIRLFGRPNTAFEARWNGGSYVAIGTSDAAGYLAGALAAQDKGNGTLTVREAGSATTRTVATVAVGFLMVVMGESEAAGRGSNVTHTIPSGFLRAERANWTTASNHYWKLLCQKIYDEYGCVINVTYNAAGGTFMVPVTTEAHWDPGSARTTVTNNYAVGQGYLLQGQMDLLTPNLFLWDIGKNDANSPATEAQFLAKFPEILAGYQAINPALEFWHILSGENGSVPAANTDAIRRAQISLAGVSGFHFAGSFAHLDADLDGTHFDSQAQKQKAVDVVWRHFHGAGRGPRFSSASKSGSTITVTLTGGVSPLTLSGGSGDVAGWKVTDGAGARTVTAVAVAGLVVTLTVDQALTGSVTLQWASNNTSVGTTLLDSDATTPMPPEPFGPVAVN